MNAEIYAELAARSDYDYFIDTKEHCVPVVVIHDLNLGRMSIAENIESIIAHICYELDANLDGLPILMRTGDEPYVLVEYTPDAIDTIVKMHSLNVYNRSEALHMARHIDQPE